ncbi:hypothetical protein HDV03_004763 [Kappamyces sp. JEL0829]|nr:hypothetical protein HDV03_004763 [Kappamyces sp. JEL0829]
MANDGDTSDESKDTEFEDVEMIDEMSDNEEMVPAASTENSLYAPPTNQELLDQKETLLFKNNLFKLQMGELVKEAHVKPASAVKACLHQIKELLDQLEPSPACSLQEATAALAPLVIPFASHAPPSSDTLVKFAFAKPARVAVVGSFLLDTMTRHHDGQTNVDVALEMPPACLQEKDLINHRYFHKRAYYLAVIAQRIKKLLPKQYKMQFSCFQHDEKRPTLVLKSTETNPNHFSKKGLAIRLFAYAPSSFFARAKLSPLRNSVRPNQQDTTRAPPTPHYNASLLLDLHMPAHLNLIHSCMQEAPALKECIILSKVWLAQRSLDGRDRVGYGLNGFLISMILVWLVRVKSPAVKKIGKSYSSYQMFRVLVDFLASYDFSQPLFLTDNTEPLPEAEFSQSAFQAQYDVAIVDPTGTINLANYITKSAMSEVQYEARLTLGLLNDTLFDRFEDLFLKKVHQEWLKYDNVFRIPSLGEVPSFTQADFVNYGTMAEFGLRKLYLILSSGLSDRTKCIAISCPPPSSWGIDEAPVAQTPADITIGVVLDPDTSLRQVEHGPDADNVSAVKEFKQLWGPRSEMRRFQDGTIKESVVFDCDGTMEQKILLVARMTAYLLSRHFQVGEDDGVTYWAGLGNKYVRSPGSPIHVKSFQSVMDAYQAVTKELRALDLPLAIHRTHIKNDALAYCSVFVPQPIEDKELVSRASPAEFLIEFESSGKWPDDVSAIETMKRAFYIRIVNLLEAAGSETMAAVGVGAGNESCLFLTHNSGQSFKVHIHNSRVGYLLERAMKDPAASPSTKASLSTYYRQYKRFYVQLPAHYNLISNLCLRYHFLGQTIRLAKRWLASHLLLSPSIVSPQVVEIICARIYTHPTAFGPPSSGWTGFVRMLELLQSWKWTAEPLIVELEEGKMTAAKRKEIGDRFMSLSHGGAGHISMYIATEMDPDGNMWGSLDVNIKIMERFVMIARQSLLVVKETLLSGAGNDISQLFITPSSGYHAIIHLDCGKLLAYLNNVNFDATKVPVRSSKFKNVLDARDRQLLALSLIDPLREYVKDLESTFGEVAYFFADAYGGDKVAVVWKLGQLQETPFKVNLAYNAMPTKQEKMRVEAFGKLFLSSITMFAGCLFFGNLPLTLSLNETKLNLVTTFGAGMLLGAAFIIILPEGVETIYDAQIAMSQIDPPQALAPSPLPSPTRSVAKRESLAPPSFAFNEGTISRDIGVSLLLGFGFMLMVDQFSAYLQRWQQGTHLPISVSEFVRDREVAHTSTPTLGFIIHAAADGIAMGAAFSSEASDVEWIVFLAIMLHKAPSAFGLATFLLAKRLSRVSILKNLVVFSLAAPLAAILTFLMIGLFDSGNPLVVKYRTGLVLLFSAGTFLYVASVHILPEIYLKDHASSHSSHEHHSHQEKNLSYPQIFCLVFGMVVPMILSIQHEH